MSLDTLFVRGLSDKLAGHDYTMSLARVSAAGGARGTNTCVAHGNMAHPAWLVHYRL